ncbi:MAG: NosD domain-containing protein, partial [Promethearchaeota archaeon]
MKIKEFGLVILTFFLFILLTINFATFKPFSVDNNLSKDFGIDTNLKNSGYWNLTGSPIVIDNLDPTKNWSYTALNYDWCSGSGTFADPYIIENVTIDGEGSSMCIKIQNSLSVYFIIKNCTFSGSFSGIFLINTNNGKIINNNCFNNHRGIYLYSTNNITIVNNNYLNNSYGIYSYSSMNVILSGNLFYHDGIFFFGSKQELSSYSIDTTNLVNDKPIYYYANETGLNQGDFMNAGQILLVNCNNSIISGVNVSDTLIGMLLYHTNNLTIHNNIINHNIGGVFLYNVSNSQLLQNTLIDNHLGIYIYGCFNLSMTNNLMYFTGILIFSPKNFFSSYSIDTTNLVNNKPVYYYVNEIGLIPENFSDAGQVILANCNNSLIANTNVSSGSLGISLYYSNNNIIKNNIANKNYFDGILLSYSINNIILKNTFEQCELGIHLDDLSNNNTILKNIVCNNYLYGIYLSSSSNDNIFSENFIKNNNESGILLYGTNNLFYRNYLVGNKVHVRGSRSNNNWNNSIIGNFWDNYTGVDANHDG